jgi:hypothetical protein
MNRSYIKEIVFHYFINRPYIFFNKGMFHSIPFLTGKNTDKSFVRINNLSLFNYSRYNYLLYFFLFLCFLLLLLNFYLLDNDSLLLLDYGLILFLLYMMFLLLIIIVLALSLFIFNFSFLIVLYIGFYLYNFLLLLKFCLIFSNFHRGLSYSLGLLLFLRRFGFSLYVI